MIELKTIRSVPAAPDLLYVLLQERTPEQSISHKEMPTLAEHDAFIQSDPYLAWYLICNMVDGENGKPVCAPVGSVYLTRQREVGIFIFNKYKGSGIGTDAINLLVDKHPGTFYANINPDNFASHMFFQEKFHAKLIQHTYECHV